jgi:hypothetical protein
MNNATTATKFPAMAVVPLVSLSDAGTRKSREMKPAMMATAVTVTLV